jgi:CRISPR-associated exonuclease Cas4
MAQVTGTHINYFFVCQRKLWLFSNGIQMEHTSDLVYEGKLIHENSYPQRSDKYSEVEIGNIKIDYYDAKNKVVHEIKKSDKKEEAHLWQLKYYLYILEKNGVDDVKGILEYPELRETQKVELTDDDRLKITELEKKIIEIISSNTVPEKLKISKCRQCSYFDFCWSGEQDN